MTRILLIICIALLSVVKSNAQNINEKIDAITFKIDSITNVERKLLKNKIKNIEKQYNNDEITLEEAENKKQLATEKHANNIKKEITILEDELHVLIQERVNKRLINPKETDKKTVLYIGSDGIHVKTKNEYKTYKKRRENARTYSNLVLAFGLNNLVDKTDLNSIDDSPFEFGSSRFFELGLNYKTRIFEKSPLWYVNYGLSARYNNLKFKDNQHFVVNGDVTSLETFDHNYKKAKFKNVQLVVPVFLELDFTKPKTIKSKNNEQFKKFKRNGSFRFGIGAFGGINLKSKQKIIYKLDGNRKKVKEVGDFNVNRFVYGLNTFIGYRDTSFYVKYDMNDLFNDNFKDQHNFSFGVRFDL